MIIYWSMIFWTFLIYILYDITHKEEIALTDYNLQQGIQRRVPWAYAFLVFGYFIFWASMRHYVARKHMEDNFDKKAVVAETIKIIGCTD